MELSKEDKEYFEVKGGNVSNLTVLFCIILTIACYTIPLWIK